MLFIFIFVFVTTCIFTSYSGCTDKYFTQNTNVHLDLSLSQVPPSLSAPKIASSAVQGIKSALLVVVSELT